MSRISKELECWRDTKDVYEEEALRFEVRFPDWTPEEVAIAVYATTLVVFFEMVTDMPDVPSERQLRQARRLMPAQCRRWIRARFGVGVPC